jgi:outer membrane protein TolC
MKPALVVFAVVLLLFTFELRAETVDGSAPPVGEGNEEQAPALEDLVNLALERSPAVAAQSARLEAAREQVSPAGALTDPELDVSVQGALMQPNTPVVDQTTLEVNQELPFPGKRKLRRDAASAEAERQAVELLKIKRRLIADVRINYAELYALDQEREYLTAARELLLMIAATAAARYEAGQSSQEALLKAQLAVSRLSERLEDLRAEREAVVAEFNRLLDEPADHPIGAVTKLPAVEFPEPLNHDDVESSPDVVAQQMALEAAQHRLDAARRDVYPDFLVGFGGGVGRNYVDNSFMPMGMVRLGITLPIWQNSRQRPLIRSAEHERQASVEERRDAMARVRSAVVRLKAEWRRNERQITLFREAILPQTHAALEAARSSYLTGQGDFSVVIEDFNLWLDARVELAGRESSRLATWAELEVLLPVNNPDETQPNEGEQP